MDKKLSVIPGAIDFDHIAQSLGLVPIRPGLAINPAQLTAMERAPEGATFVMAGMFRYSATDGNLADLQQWLADAQADMEARRAQIMQEQIELERKLLDEESEGA